LCCGRFLLAFKFVNPTLQRVDLPHQVFDGWLLCQCRTGNHRRTQDTDEKT
jgi:hypothetical protein